jgi:propanediol dehydratase large subunit
MPRGIEPFLLVVADHNKKVFSIEGPMTDDRPWNHAVVAAQHTGRTVRCFTPGAGQGRNEVARNYSAQMGYSEVDSYSIVDPRA